MIIYVLFVVSIIFICTYIAHEKEMTVDSYFFANKRMHWAETSFSLVLGSIFSVYFLALTTTSFLKEIPMLVGILSVLILFLLGWVFYPFYSKSQIQTIPDYFEKRFNRKSGLFVSIVYIFTNVFLRLLIILLSASYFLNHIIGIDAFVSLIFFLLLTGIYILIGGLLAEMHVNIVHTVFIILALFGLMIWFVLKDKSVYDASSNITSYAHSFIDNDIQVSKIGLLLYLPIICFWFWCADQQIVQKILSIRDRAQFKKTTLLSVVLQIIPVFIFVVPFFLFLFFAKSTSIEDMLIDFFHIDFLPSSLRAGLILVIASSLMASLAGVFNSTSLLFAFDFYRRRNADASDQKLVFVGRMTTILIMAFAILLVPITQLMEYDLCIEIINVFIYLIVLITAVFISGFIFRKASGDSAFITLVVVTCVILVKVILNITLTYRVSQPNILHLTMNLSFIEFSLFIFLFSFVLIFIFSIIELIQSKLSTAHRINSELSNSTSAKKL